MDRASSRPPSPHEEGSTPARVEVAFDEHIELLRSFLARRSSIVDKIEPLLNAQRRPLAYVRDVAELSRLFEACFFALPGAAEQARLRSELDEAHWASGFKPRRTEEVHNDLVDPAEMMSRAFRLWQHTRWPGRHGRVHYAQTLFNVYVLRRLMLLCMRVWDAESASARLSRIQSVLDELWETSPADQPVLVRDARWLLPLAQSPTTDELHGYFDVAQRVAENLPETDRTEIDKASVRMAGGHLRSQLRHVASQKNVSLDDNGLILSTRKSNALDLATLMQALVPLLDAYERAVERGDEPERTALADAICQGVSPDPELFVNRLDLFGPYTMIEHLFIATGEDGRAFYTPTGLRHLALLHEYEQRIVRMARALNEDCERFRPVAGAYSPYAALYGFSSTLLEHMAFKTLTPDADTRFALEDVFVGGQADKRSWVSGWRKLPHVPREVAKLFDYPQTFAEDIFERIEAALHKRVAATDLDATSAVGRLFVVPEGEERRAAPALAADLAPDHVVSSDRDVIAARRAQACDEKRLLHSRFEGEFLVSYRTSGGWVGISKDVLSAVVGTGRDARIVLPDAAARVLALMCPKIVALAHEGA